MFLSRCSSSKPVSRTSGGWMGGPNVGPFYWEEVRELG